MCSCSTRNGCGHSSCSPLLDLHACRHHPRDAGRGHRHDAVRGLRRRPPVRVPCVRVRRGDVRPDVVRHTVAGGARSPSVAGSFVDVAAADGIHVFVGDGCGAANVSRRVARVGGRAGSPRPWRSPGACGCTRPMRTVRCTPSPPADLGALARAVADEYILETLTNCLTSERAFGRVPILPHVLGAPEPHHPDVIGRWRVGGPSWSHCSNRPRTRAPIPAPSRHDERRRDRGRADRVAA